MNVRKGGMRYNVLKRIDTWNENMLCRKLRTVVWTYVKEANEKKKMKLLFVGISNNDCCIGDYGIGRRSRLSAEIRGVRQSEDLSCLTSLLKKKRQYRTDRWRLGQHIWQVPRSQNLQKHHFHHLFFSFCPPVRYYFLKIIIFVVKSIPVSNHNDWAKANPEDCRRLLSRKYVSNCSQSIQKCVFIE